MWTYCHITWFTYRYQHFEKSVATCFVMLDLVPFLSVNSHFFVSEMFVVFNIKVRLRETAVQGAK